MMVNHRPPSELIEHESVSLVLARLQREQLAADKATEKSSDDIEVERLAFVNRSYTVCSD